MRKLSAGPWTDWQPRTVQRDGGLVRDDLRWRQIAYRATFWEAPCEPGKSGRYVERDCKDVQYERRSGSRRFMNTARSVSFYGALEKAYA